jgi:hypothetical protein
MEVTSTHALMASPPVLTRRFSRAPTGRSLFIPTIHDSTSSTTAIPDLAEEKEVGLHRPPPQQ